MGAGRVAGLLLRLMYALCIAQPYVSNGSHGEESARHKLVFFFFFFFCSYLVPCSGDLLLQMRQLHPARLQVLDVSLSQNQTNLN